MSEKYTIRSVKRALLLLKSFTEEKSQFTLKELSEHLDLNKSTVFRLLETLEDQGFIISDDSGKYILGNEIVRLSNVEKRNNDIRIISHKYMKELAELTDETVILAELFENSIVCIDKIESKQALKITSQIGSTVPFFRGATGKIITAYLNEKRLQSIINNKYDIIGENNSYEQLKDELKKVRNLGYCSTQGEVDYGVRAIAVPIFINEIVKFSISVAGPSNRFDEHSIKNLIERMCNISNELSKQNL